MTVIQNELFDEPFTAVELTNAINRLPFTAPSLDPQFTWTTTLSLTTSVRLHMTNGKVEIAPYVPRGGVPPVFQGSKRSALQVEIPAIAGRASAHNREALNATAGVTGETRLLTLETLRDEKSKVMSEAIDQGEARQCAEAVKGLITDPDNARTVVDLYALQGKEQIEVDLDLTGGKSLNDQIEEIKEISEQKLGGIRPDSFKLITGDEASKIIRKNKEYKELLTDPLSNYLAKVDGRRTVAINDNVDLVPYKNSLHWEADDAFLVPIYSGHAQIVYGPHESDEFWGQILPRYATSEPMPHGKGLEMEAWAYVLRYFQHPEAILKVNVLG